jgi:hypothetical protein
MGKKKKKKAEPLGNLPSWASNLKPQGEVERGKLAVLILSVGAGVIAAQVLGNHPRNTLISLLTAAGGIYTNNMYLTAAGASMLVTAATSPAEKPADFKSGAKARLDLYFKSLKEKVKPADATKTPAATEQGTETTSVNGLNVYSNPLAVEQGMNQLNEIERQLEQMNGTTEEDQQISDLPDREL